MNITIYADGAVKNNGGPGRVGMGAVLLHLVDGKIRHQKNCSWGEDADPATNQLAELLAMHYSLQQVRVPASTDLTLYSDSQWARNSILGLYKNACHVDLIRTIRTQLEEFRSTNLIWLRGHDGHKWNELANELAQKEAGTWKGK
jgi:ribonuclease HI